MDTSKTYIKMCDCPEIQGQWKKLDGDVFHGSGWWGYAKPMILFDANSCCMILPKEDAIWLPRQDQIQKMIYSHQDGVAYLTVELYGWLQKPREHQPKSMEQLWLAFYMYEKHGKVWDGEKWEKK